MEGEIFDKLTKQDVVQFPKPAESAWQESLRRIARAQALLWNSSPITVRQAILARVDQEAERMQR